MQEYFETKLDKDGEGGEKAGENLRSLARLPGRILRQRQMAVGYFWVESRFM